MRPSQCIDARSRRLFDRAACGEARLTVAPYVSAAALSALRDLLRRALKGYIRFIERA
jgi:hypothetical protein